MTGFEIRDTKHKGKGLFSLKHYDKEHIILRFDGEFVSYKDIFSKNIPYNVSERYLQIGLELYLNIEKHPGVFINHSCRPNCYIKIAINNAFLVSLYPISPGEELTYDYALTSTETHETFSMLCSCNNYGCRKTISGFSCISEEQRKKYIALGRAPKYIEDK